MLLVAASLVACGSAARLTFIPDGGPYTAEELPALLASADLTAVASIKTEDGPHLRQEMLTSLRRQGDDAAALADTLTREFPADVTSVPLVVERATYDGSPVWIVIESWGEDGGTLSHRRLWVFSYEERAVVAALSAP
jgi:hypothetical protein